jgi:hypothetical protein
MIAEIDLLPLWEDLGKWVTVDGERVRAIDMSGQNPDPIFDGLSRLALAPRELASYGEQVEHYIMVLPSDVSKFTETTEVVIDSRTYRTHPPSKNAVGVGFVFLTEYRGI